MSEFITQYETELNTGEREVPPILDEEELNHEETLLEKTMGDDFKNFFEV